MIRLTDNDKEKCRDFTWYDYTITDLLREKLLEENTILAQKCYKILDNDLYSITVKDGKMITKSHTLESMPNYFYDYMKKLIERNFKNG